MKNLPLPRLDRNSELHDYLLRFCRLDEGQIWSDPSVGHKVGCLDAGSRGDIERLMGGERATLAVHDPPYNSIAFDRRDVCDFISWSSQWIDNTASALAEDSSLYIWLGAAQDNGFEPLPEFMVMMRDKPFASRSFITLRNQRGYGTAKNWMAVRQELLYYTRGRPVFNVDAAYTDIPRVLRGYYKKVGGKVTENAERSKSENIRAGNVWVDIQQIFYRMGENVNGCYAQKPLKSYERIVAASSAEGEVIIDFFCHSGTALICAEMLNRRCYTIDTDPVYCEIAIRRLERLRETGETGFQNSNPFEEEMMSDSRLIELVSACDESKTKTVASP